MAEMADAWDLKSQDRKVVRVQFPLRVPKKEKNMCDYILQHFDDGVWRDEITSNDLPLLQDNLNAMSKHGESKYGKSKWRIIQSDQKSNLKK